MNDIHNYTHCDMDHVDWWGSLMFSPITLHESCYKTYSLGNVTIPDDVTFTVVSDLNGDSAQFTLTCNSNGGPATTVTWTRDSETVSKGMTVLGDPKTAQYTHTLTVTGRLGGMYQCNVSNNKPSQASASFTVEGQGCQSVAK